MCCWNLLGNSLTIIRIDLWIATTFDLNLWHYILISSLDCRDENIYSIYLFAFFRKLLTQASRSIRNKSHLKSHFIHQPIFTTTKRWRNYPEYISKAQHGNRPGQQICSLTDARLYFGWRKHYPDEKPKQMDLF